MNAPKASQNDDTQEGETRPVGHILQKISDELIDAARACTEIQWLVSMLLEQAHHPDLPAELHMLQDIDRIHQTLGDLAALSKRVSEPAHALHVETSEIAASLKLDSLRDRILGTHSEVDECIDDTGITWL